MHIMTKSKSHSPLAVHFKEVRGVGRTKDLHVYVNGLFVAREQFTYAESRAARMEVLAAMSQESLYGLLLDTQANLEVEIEVLEDTLKQKKERLAGLRALVGR
jgi:hypothetical protein